MAGFSLPVLLHLAQLCSRSARSCGCSALARRRSGRAKRQVYEYAVEPADLQNLSDHALLPAVRGPAGPQLRAVECDPAMATLPGISGGPLAPVPQVSAAQLPQAAAAGWPGSAVRQSNPLTCP